MSDEHKKNGLGKKIARKLASGAKKVASGAARGAKEFGSGVAEGAGIKLKKPKGKPSARTVGKSLGKTIRKALMGSGKRKRRRNRQSEEVAPAFGMFDGDVGLSFDVLEMSGLAGAERYGRRGRRRRRRNGGGNAEIAPWLWE